MSQLVRVRCPECQAGLRVPETEDEALITCPRCGAEFSPQASPAPAKKKGPAAPPPADDDDDEDKAGPSAKPGKGKREEEDSPKSNQTLIIGSIIALAVIASLAAVIIPIMMKDPPKPQANAAPAPQPPPAGAAPVAAPTPPAENPAAPMPPTKAPADKGASAKDGKPMTPEKTKTPPLMPPEKTNPEKGKPPVGKGDPPVKDGAKPAPKPELTLDQAKVLIVGGWETAVINPRNKKTIGYTHQFTKDGKYTYTAETDGAKEERAGYYELVLYDDKVIVSMNSAPIKNGKPISNKTANSVMIQFSGNDTLLMSTYPQTGAKLAFARQK